MKQLEAIRKQNYVERKNLQYGGGDGKLYVPKNENVPDPRYDPDARRRKIEALKVRKFFFQFILSESLLLLSECFV